MSSVELYIRYIHSIINKEYNKKQFAEKEKAYLILYFYTFHKVFNDSDSLTKVNFLLNQYYKESFTIDNFGNEYIDTFFGSLCFLSEKKYDILDENRIFFLNKYLFDTTFDLLQQKDLHHFQSIILSLNYFSLCLPDIVVEKYLYQLLPLLYKVIERCTSHKTSDGTENKSQFMNLGFFDGLSGILLVLLRIYDKGIDENNIIGILKPSIRYILSLKREMNFDSGNYSMFPYSVNKFEEKVKFSNKLSWASSDLNQAILFHKSYRLINDRNLLKIADLIGLNTLLRQDITSTQIVDSNFLNGAAGVAQSYKNLYKISKHQAYWDGYEFWIDKTTAILEQEKNNGKYLNPDLSLLSGLTGVGLTLLSYISEEELYWNKYFFT